MRFFPALAGVAVRTWAALPGESSRSFTRGQAAQGGFAVLCRACHGVVAANVHEPNSVTIDCGCGAATRANWRTTTETLPGWRCANCGRVVFWADGQPARWTCTDGAHDPAPVAAIRPGGR